MPNFKAGMNVNGGWINGRWHPNGSIAAQTGGEPPVEKTVPAHPDWREPAKVKAEPVVKVKAAEAVVAAETSVKAAEAVVGAEASSVKVKGKANG